MGMAVPASCLFVGASLFVSTGLALFAASLVFLDYLLSPEHGDCPVAALVDSYVERKLRLACAAVGAEARRLRDAAMRDPLLEPIYDRAEERARRAHAFVADGVDGLKAATAAKLCGLTDAAVAAFYWLRLAAGVINLAAVALTAVALREAETRVLPQVMRSIDIASNEAKRLIGIAREEARTRVLPSVLRWRGVKAIRPRPCADGEASDEPDTTLLVVWIVVIVMYCTQVFVLYTATSGVTSFPACFACLAALCGFALMEAERIYLWDSYEIDTGDGGNDDTVDTGDAAGAGSTAALSVEEDAWEFLRNLIILSFYAEYYFLFIMGARPAVIAFVGICKIAANEVARKARRSSPDGVSQWGYAAAVVLAIDSAKVSAIHFMFDSYFAAQCFVCLCVATALVVDKAQELGDAQAAREVAAGVSDDARAEDSSTVAGSDHEHEVDRVSTTEEHIDQDKSDVSDSEYLVEKEQSDASDSQYNVDEELSDASYSDHHVEKEQSDASDWQYNVDEELSASDVEGHAHEEEASDASDVEGHEHEEEALVTTEQSDVSDSEQYVEENRREEVVSVTEEHSDLTDAEQSDQEENPHEEEVSATEEHSGLTDAEQNDEEEVLATEKRFHSADSEYHVQENRQDEPEHSSGSSTDGDGWSIVDVDPVMPTKMNRATNRKFSFTRGIRGLFS